VPCNLETLVGMLKTNQDRIKFWEGVSENAKNFVAKCEVDGVDEDSTDPQPFAD